MTREEIIDGLEIYTAGRLNKDRVHITVKELQKFIDAIKALEKEPCEDAISRQDALNCLTATGLKKFDFILDARNKIKNLPSVTPRTKWIPCSERLPEKNGLYLVTQLRYSLDDIDYKRPPLGKEVDYVEYQDGWCGSRIFDVIAWMPFQLPEPFAPDTDVDSNEESEE